VGNSGGEHIHREREKGDITVSFSLENQSKREVLVPGEKKERRKIKHLNNIDKFVETSHLPVRVPFWVFETWKKSRKKAGKGIYVLNDERKSFCRKKNSLFNFFERRSTNGKRERERVSESFSCRRFN